MNWKNASDRIAILRKTSVIISLISAVISIMAIALR